MKTAKEVFALATLAVLFFFLSITQGACSEQKSIPDVKGSIQIKGSDTMVNLGQAWAEEFMKRYPGASVAVTGGGSGTGISSLISGTCDIAESSRAMTLSEIQKAKQHGVNPVEYKVGLDGIAVIVHPSNPVDKLTISQLRDIFTGKITNWKELGGTNSKIVLLSREVNSGTHVFFKEHVLWSGGEKPEFAPQALLLPSSQAIADEVSQNPSTIGYYGMGYLSANQKAVAVAKDASSPYVPPTVDNVLNNSYPISRPLLMYTRGEPTGVVRTFMDFVLSPEGQKIVEEIDFVPVKK